MKACAISSERHRKSHLQASGIYTCSKQSPNLKQLKYAYVVNEKKLKQPTPPEINLLLRIPQRGTLVKCSQLLKRRRVKEAVHLQLERI